MTGRPGLAALAVLRRGGEVLLVRRRNEPDAGLWGYPGGHLERGETIRQGALRELSEKTGMTAHAGPLLALIEVIREPHHFALAAVLCADPVGEPRPADDALAAAWIAIADICAGRVRTSRHVAEVAGRAVDPQAGVILLDGG